MSATPRPRVRHRPPEPVALSNVVELRPGFTLPEPAAEPPKKARSRTRSGVTRPPDFLNGVTKPTGKKKSKNSDLLRGPGLMEVKENEGLSPLGENPLPSAKDPTFQRQVARLSKMRLREVYHLEATAHRNMLSRAEANGCTVADEFLKFRPFLAIMGPCPAPGWTVDRKDPNLKEYSPGLVRWADKRQQANNRAVTQHLTLDGVTRPLADWARLKGVPRRTLAKRIERGWSHEEAILGRRMEDAAPAEAAPEPIPTPSPLPTDAWPLGATVAYWDGAWQAFCVKARPHLRFRITRALFFSWIGSNKLRAANAALKEAFPTYNDPEGDPADAPDVSGHPSAAILNTYTNKVAAAMNPLMADFEAMEALRFLCRTWPDVFAPDQATKISFRHVEED